MLPVARIGDIAGGPILFPCHPTIIVNMLPTAMPGSLVAGHGLPPHSAPVITPIVPTTVLLNNLFIRKIGDLSSCGHPISTGAFTVLTT